MLARDGRETAPPAMSFFSCAQVSSSLTRMWRRRFLFHCRSPQDKTKSLLPRSLRIARGLEALDDEFALADRVLVFVHHPVRGRHHSLERVTAFELAAPTLTLSRTIFTSTSASSRHDITDRCATSSAAAIGAHEQHDGLVAAERVTVRRTSEPLECPVTSFTRGYRLVPVGVVERFQVLDVDHEN